MSTTGGERAPTPVRIELATSELESGSFRAWANPSQVLTVLAMSEPPDAFQRFVEPKLRELGVFPEGTKNPDATAPIRIEAGADAPRVPPLAQALIDKLREVHARLHRENQSLMRDPCRIALTCALADEDRLYLLKGAPSWTCLLRQGRAYSIGQGGATHAGDLAIGSSESLRLEMTSLSVEAGDTVILLAADSEVTPDLHAVIHLFGRTVDLKRACDGLVNLLGLQSQGACAVAFRFLAIGSTQPGNQRANPLDGLAEEFEREVSLAAALDARSNDAELKNQDALLEEVWDRTFQTPPQAPPAPQAVEAPPRAAPVAPSGAPEPRELAGAEVAGVPNPTSGRGASADQRPHRRGFAFTLILAALVLGLGVLVAVPRPRDGASGSGGWAARLLGGEGKSQAGGSIEIRPDPPAQAVILDGQPIGSGTPTRLDGVSRGRHRIGLDLGPSGIWETEVTIGKGESRPLAPHLTGSIEVVSENPDLPGRAWMSGRGKAAVPAEFDSVPVGWNRIFYEDEEIPMWDRSVLVKAGRTTRITVPNAVSTGQGRVKVEALLYQEREGLVESKGDSVWLDGLPVGSTPWETDLPPGLHSVRVGSGATGSCSEVLEIKTGGIRHVVAQLGQGETLTLRHVPPGRVRATGAIYLSVEVVGGMEGTWSRPTLHLPELGPGERELPLRSVDGRKGVYIGAIATELLPAERRLAYYFTVVDADGQTVWSDLYHLQSQPAERPAGEDTTGLQQPSVSADSEAR